MFNLPKAIQLHNFEETAPFLGTGPETLLRIPEALRVHLNDSAKHRAFHSAGCELRFRLNHPAFKIHIETCDVGATQHGGGLAQILFGDFSHCYFPVGMGTTAFECTAPALENLQNVSDSPFFDPRLVRVLLPTHTAICDIKMEGAFGSPEPGDIPAKRVLHYGSSITQGAGSLSSRESWAGICARNLNADLINLGFGGGCHCEPEMTDYLCARHDFDFAVLETGINMLGLPPETADANIQNLIRKFTAAHADKPVFFLGVFPCRNDVETRFTGRAQAFRDLIKTTVDALHLPQVHFIDGKQLLDLRTGFTTDLTHPSPAGMIQIGEMVAQAIHNLLPPS